MEVVGIATSLGSATMNGGQRSFEKPPTRPDGMSDEPVSALTGEFTQSFAKCSDPHGYSAGVRPEVRMQALEGQVVMFAVIVGDRRSTGRRYVAHHAHDLDDFAQPADRRLKRLAKEVFGPGLGCSAEA